MANADTPYYGVETRLSTRTIKQLPKGMEAAVILYTPATDQWHISGYCQTTDMAKQIARYLNDSLRANTLLGITPRCGEPSCDEQRLIFGINITAVPCSDCGYIPGVRNNDKLRRYQKTAGRVPIVEPDSEAKVSSLKASSVPIRMDQNRVMTHMKKVAGRILTLIDASLPEGSQRTAFKSLIKREVRQELEKVNNFFTPPNCEQSFDPEIPQEIDV